MTDPQVEPATTRALPLVIAPPRRREKPPRHLADLSAEERAAAAAELGEPAFRVKQVAHHYFGRLERDPANMTDLPAKNRDAIASALLPKLLDPVRTMEADTGTTRKTLWRLFDGALVESVLMRYPERATICVSSQAGCAMACPFCATGQGGLQRNMSTAEIIDQVVDGAAAMANGLVPGGPGRLSNVVFMGMGEPMANYKAVIGAIRRMVAPAPDGLGMSARNITLSTVGLVPRIKQLTDEGIPVTLAVSLHAPDDELRNQLVPINRRHNIADLLEACWHYIDEQNGRSVTFEYVMLDGVNDSPAQARALARLLKGRPAKVNLIPFNPFPGTQYRRSRPEVIKAFLDQVLKGGVMATIRRTRGDDIDAACGQLVGKVTDRTTIRMGAKRIATPVVVEASRATQ